MKDTVLYTDFTMVRLTSAYLARRRCYVDISMPQISVPWQVISSAPSTALGTRRHKVWPERWVEMPTNATALGRNAGDERAALQCELCLCHCIRILSTAKTTFCSRGCDIHTAVGGQGGVFVELGALDSVLYSNTLAL